MKENQTKISTFRLSESMYKDITDLASEETRPVSNMMRLLITEALKARKEASHD